MNATLPVVQTAVDYEFRNTGRVRLAGSGRARVNSCRRHGPAVRSPGVLEAGAAETQGRPRRRVADTSRVRRLPAAPATPVHCPDGSGSRRAPGVLHTVRFGSPAGPGAWGSRVHRDEPAGLVPRLRAVHRRRLRETWGADPHRSHAPRRRPTEERASRVRGHHRNAQVLLDPFAGSGSTVAAAIECSLTSIGLVAGGTKGATNERRHRTAE